MSAAVHTSTSVNVCAEMPKPAVAYYRVSTAKQGRSGLGLDAQRASVHALVGTPIAEFTEVESGKRNDRPQLAAALAYAKRHKATLVIAKLDRLARNNAFVANLLESRVDIRCADMPEADRTMLQMMSVFAEFEARAIGRRVKEALAQAKQRGTRLGTHSAVLSAENRAAALAFAASVAPEIEAIRGDGHNTVRAITVQLNARGVATSTGGTWHVTSVQRLLSRINGNTQST